jgi:hypothetical protein
MDKAYEGWYSDPFARHEARWMSGGNPTHLVRDGETESNDPPPDAPWKVTPVRIVSEVIEEGPRDLLRADDLEKGTYDRKELIDRTHIGFEEPFINGPEQP